MHNHLSSRRLGIEISQEEQNVNRKSKGVAAELLLNCRAKIVAFSVGIDYNRILIAMRGKTEELV